MKLKTENTQKALEKELRDKLEALTILEARENLLTFIRAVNPNFIVGDHHRKMCRELERLERGDILRLMIFMPPRSSKSLIISRYFPAWVVGRHPEWQQLLVSHSGDLAEYHGKEVRNLIDTNLYRRIFPATRIRQDSRAGSYWITTREGVFATAGIGGGIAGKGYHMGIIDDPHNEQTAYSRNERESIIQWFPGGFISRQMPSSRVVITTTRWHENDLAGWLLAEEFASPPKDPRRRWTIISFPAILDEFAPTERSYWPEWKPLDELLAVRDGPPPLPRYQWDALYMQRPSPEGGGILKKTWWMQWEQPKPPTVEYILMTMDTAYSEKERADYSAITVWGVFKDERITHNFPHMILLDAKRGRWSYPNLKDNVFDKITEHNPDTIIIEGKASGQSLVQDLRESGIPVIEYKPQKGSGKDVRVHASSSVFSSGRIWAPQRTWAQDVINECASFPAGEYDDYVDATTMAVLWLKSGGWVPADPDEDLNEKPFNVVKYYT